MSDDASVAIALDGSAVPSVTRVTSAAAEVLVLSTSITDPVAPVTLHSSYVAARGGDTAVTHLLLSNVRPASEPEQIRRPAHALPVTNSERHLCLYDHLQRLLAGLRDLGFEASIEVHDRAVELVDR